MGHRHVYELSLLSDDVEHQERLDEVAEVDSLDDDEVDVIAADDDEVEDRHLAEDDDDFVMHDDDELEDTVMDDDDEVEDIFLVVVQQIEVDVDDEVPLEEMRQITEVVVDEVDVIRDENDVNELLRYATRLTEVAEYAVLREELRVLRENIQYIHSHLTEHSALYANIYI